MYGALTPHRTIPCRQFLSAAPLTVPRHVRRRQRRISASRPRHSPSCAIATRGQSWKLGTRAVAYRRADLDEWVARCTGRSTSDHGSAAREAGWRSLKSSHGFGGRQVERSHSLSLRVREWSTIDEGDQPSSFSRFELTCCRREIARVLGGKAPALRLPRRRSRPPAKRCSRSEPKRALACR